MWFGLYWCHQFILGYFYEFVTSRYFVCIHGLTIVLYFLHSFVERCTYKIISNWFSSRIMQIYCDVLTSINSTSTVISKRLKTHSFEGPRGRYHHHSLVSRTHFGHSLPATSSSLQQSSSHSEYSSTFGVRLAWIIAPFR